MEIKLMVMIEMKPAVSAGVPLFFKLSLKVCFISEWDSAIQNSLTGPSRVDTCFIINRMFFDAARGKSPGPWA